MDRLMEAPTAAPRAPLVRALRLRASSVVALLPVRRRLLWPALLLAAMAAAAARHLGDGGGGGAVVGLGTVTRGPLSVEVLATGTVQPTDRLELRYPDEAAEVETVLVEAGQAVEAGQPLVELVAGPLRERHRRAESEFLEVAYRLAELRSGRRQARLQELELAVSRAEAELSFQEKGLSQIRELAEAGLTAKTEVLRAEHEVVRAQLDLKDARQRLTSERRAPAEKEMAFLEAQYVYRKLALERAQEAIGRRQLRSPGRGTVLEAPARRGTVLRQGDLVAVIADVRRFRVSALVDEMQVGVLRCGQPVAIRSEFFGTTELAGSIERLVPTVRRERGVSSVEALVAVPAGAWEPPVGLNVDIRIRIDETHDVTRAPLEAVVERQDQSVVFVYEGGGARQQPVKIGLRNDTLVEVVSGLRPGQKVITSGHAFLQDGASVRPSAPDGGALQVEFFSP